MRINLPVTTVEHELRADAPIVSKTDTKGRIVYINPAFIEISGFTEEELLGQSHNIVRHPDMPPEAFADMWATLQAGMPWSGMVKNRCKNGDFYWVVANVTPVWKNGQLDGYMSVRTKPESARIKETDAVYRAFRENRARGLAIRKGRAVRTGLFHRLLRLRYLPVAVQMSLVFGFLLLLLGSFGVASFLRGEWVQVAAAAAGMGIAGAFWWNLHQQVAQPLREATFLARRTAGGDLTCCANGGQETHFGEFGELLQALSQMSVNLQAMIGDIGESVESMKTATERIAGANAELSDRSSAQAASLEETAASLEELSSVVSRNAERSVEANRIASAASGVATNGGEVFARVGVTMGEIKGSSSKIAAITKVIDGIAFQTNILALNASVEAARAGEHGAGFAVVAEEVRSLAQRSATAAKDIEVLIRESVEKVASGHALVGELSGTMEQLIRSVGEVTEVVGEIAAANKEQSIGIGQINETVVVMDKATQQNAAMSAESLHDTQNLAEQAGRLSSAVSVFQLAQGDPSSRRTRRASASAAASDWGKEMQRRSRMTGDVTRVVRLPASRRVGAFVGE